MKLNKQNLEVLPPAPNFETLPELVLQLEAFCKEARRLIAEELQAGRPVPNAALIPSVSHRKWVDSRPLPEVRRIISAELLEAGKPGGLNTIAPRSLLSVAQVEKLMGKAQFAQRLSHLVDPPKPTGDYNLKLF